MSFEIGLLGVVVGLDVSIVKQRSFLLLELVKERVEFKLWKCGKLKMAGPEKNRKVVSETSIINIVSGDTYIYVITM